MSELDIAITPELLSTMYNKQYELQCFMKEKRGLTQPPSSSDSYITHDHVLAAIYFSSCVNIEWTELQDVYSAYTKEKSKDKADMLRDDALEELIDVWHFVLSVFIFLGVKEEYVKKLVHFRIGGVNSLAEYAGDTALAISSVLSVSPYKTWKDQAKHKILDDEHQEFLFKKLSICYNDILDFAVYDLNSNYEEFVDAYMRKNDLNFRRQEDKGLGYLGD